MLPLRRPAVALGPLTALALLALPPSAAHADAGFRPGQVPAGQVVDTVLVVPVEQQDQDNQVVVLEAPGELEVVGCTAPLGFTCRTEQGRVRFDRLAGVSSAPTDSFGLRLRTPSAPGPYAFGLAQTWTDGRRVVHDGVDGPPPPTLLVVAVEVDEQAPAPTRSSPSPAAVAAAPQQAVAPAQRPQQQPAPVPRRRTPTAVTAPQAPAARPPAPPLSLTPAPPVAAPAPSTTSPVAVLLLGGAVLSSAATAVLLPAWQRRRRLARPTT